jgi:hypothetical protein
MSCNPSRRQFLKAGKAVSTAMPIEDFLQGKIVAIFNFLFQTNDAFSSHNCHSDL